MSLRGRHAKVSLTPTIRFLIVTIGGAHFALHADCVHGLLTIEEVGARPALLEHSSKIDLAARLLLPVDEQGQDARVILFSKGTTRGHLYVSQVHALQELESSQVLPLPRHFQGEEQRWYQGMILFSDSVAVILNPAWVLEGCENHATMRPAPSQIAGYARMRPVVAGGQG